ATTAPSAGSSNAISTLTFVLSRSGGTFSSVQQLIETPSGGGDGSPYFVADVFDKACGATFGANGACTGLVGVSNLTSPVPEPSSYAFLGTGLLAMVFLIRRKRTSAQSIQ
ncbi:MAG TPA: PEP-CTERM sorting domain-containing protein, partial [Bryobacteraceae bacterium]